MNLNDLICFRGVSLVQHARDLGEFVIGKIKECLAAKGKFPLKTLYFGLHHAMCFFRAADQEQVVAAREVSMPVSVVEPDAQNACLKYSVRGSRASVHEVSWWDQLCGL